MALALHGTTKLAASLKSTFVLAGCEGTFAHDTHHCPSTTSGHGADIQLATGTTTCSQGKLQFQVPWLSHPRSPGPSKVGPPSIQSPCLPNVCAKVDLPTLLSSRAQRALTPGAGCPCLCRSPWTERCFVAPAWVDEYNKGLCEKP